VLFTKDKAYAENVRGALITTHEVMSVDQYDMLTTIIGERRLLRMVILEHSANHGDGTFSILTLIKRKLRELHRTTRIVIVAKAINDEVMFDAKITSTKDVIEKDKLVTWLAAEAM
jgi:hypothetical protein